MDVLLSRNHQDPTPNHLRGVYTNTNSCLINKRRRNGNADFLLAFLSLLAAPTTQEPSTTTSTATAERLAPAAPSV